MRDVCTRETWYSVHPSILVSDDYPQKHYSIVADWQSMWREVENNDIRGSQSDVFSQLFILQQKIAKRSH